MPAPLLVHETLEHEYVSKVLEEVLARLPEASVVFELRLQGHLYIWMHRPSRVPILPLHVWLVRAVRVPDLHEVDPGSGHVGLHSDRL